MRTIAVRVGLSVLVSLMIYLLVAMGLIISDSHRAPPVGKEPLSFGALTGDIGELPPLEGYQARDGNTLSYRLYPSDSEHVLILLHGSGWHSRYLAPMARRISAGGYANVITPDLRGHGPAPIRRGDIDYTNQLVDDLADLIDHVRRDRPEATLVIGGHSSGGGLALRFAGSRYGEQADGYLLLAPWLQYNAPTIRPDGSGWATPYTRRIIGLTLLNNLGISALNNLPVIRFNMPADVRDGTETLSYSYRLNTGYAPRDYTEALSAIKQPLLVLVGSDDGLFYPEKFRPVVNRYTEGDVRVIDGASHLGIVTDESVVPAIGDWLED
ncbi:alpha/beta hydrolase [Marinobacter sp. LN3S78]|uniref:alpha/beta hydrolase n=1 Tax=Marinobacter sp. LN3S78 TaxID=3382300 RepID=UPI00387A9CF7